MVKIQHPWYEDIFIHVKKRGHYCVADILGAGKVSIVSYWPIRIQLARKGKFIYMFFRLSMAKNVNIAQSF